MNKRIKNVEELLKRQYMEVIELNIERGKHLGECLSCGEIMAEALSAVDSCMEKECGVQNRGREEETEKVGVG